MDWIGVLAQPKVTRLPISSAGRSLRDDERRQHLLYGPDLLYMAWAGKGQNGNSTSE
jgi:hypothetical protein